MSSLSCGCEQIDACFISHQLGNWAVLVQFFYSFVFNTCAKKLSKENGLTTLLQKIKE